jgi:PKD repeat protein
VAEEIIVLDSTFRSTGAPFADIRTFDVATAGMGMVKIINGGGDGSDVGKRSSSSRILLNGEEIVSPGDFGVHTVALNIKILLLEGTNKLEVTMLGKPETLLDLQVTTSDNQIPIADFTATPQSGDVPLNVSFDAGASFDPDEVFGDNIVRYDWDFGDGDTMNNGGSAPSHLYLGSGIFNAKLTVTDSFGATDSGSLLITVSPEVDLPPVVIPPDPPTPVTEEESLEAPNSLDIADSGRIVITPYIQSVANDSYTFMAFSHSSLDSAATQIGLVVEVLDMTTVPNNTAGASVHFTIDAGETHRVFVVNKAHSVIKESNPIFSDTRTHLILTQNGAQFGSARISGINENPMQPDVNNNFDNVGQISMWGIIFMPASGTGFSMEFIGDAHDSTIPFDIAGENLKARTGVTTGAGRGIN